MVSRYNHGEKSTKAPKKGQTSWGVAIWRQWKASWWQRHWGWQIFRLQRYCQREQIVWGILQVPGHLPWRSVGRNDEGSENRPSCLFQNYWHQISGFYRFYFGGSFYSLFYNAPSHPNLDQQLSNMQTNCLEWQFANKIVKNNNLQQVCPETTIICQIYKKIAIICKICKNHQEDQ